MKEELLIREYLRYVIAFLDGNVNCFLAKINNNYTFVEDASSALKFKSRDTANIYIDLFKRQQNISGDFVVIPMKISYSLINESGEIE